MFQQAGLPNAVLDNSFRSLNRGSIQSEDSTARAIKSPEQQHFESLPRALRNILGEIREVKRHLKWVRYQGFKILNPLSNLAIVRSLNRVGARVKNS